MARIMRGDRCLFWESRLREAFRNGEFGANVIPGSCLVAAAKAGWG
ncbi:MAG: hypothetical protein Q27BPR15_19360 [Rhodobacter sp. CACIA14H1]|nr:MAG: hypothetical protein Q27BPR15_19360 [Rhodobacter sp. CACIA14H1]